MKYIVENNIADRDSVSCFLKDKLDKITSYNVRYAILRTLGRYHVIGINVFCVDNIVIVGIELQNKDYETYKMMFEVNRNMKEQIGFVDKWIRIIDKTLPMSAPQVLI